MTLRQYKMIEYILLSEPTIEPITLQEAKLYLKISDNSFDDRINLLIKTSRINCENITGRDITIKSYKALINGFSYSVKLKKSKLQAIQNIKYYKNKELVTLDSSRYYIYESNDYSSVQFNDYIITDNIKQAIRIEFTAGYVTIPEVLKQGMLANIAFLFNNYGDCDMIQKKLHLDLYRQYIIGDKMFFCV